MAPRRRKTIANPHEVSASQLRLSAPAEENANRIGYEKEVAHHRPASQGLRGIYAKCCSDR